MQALLNVVRDDHRTIRIYLERISELRRQHPLLRCEALRELLAFVAARDAALAELLQLAGAAAEGAQALTSRRRACRHALCQGLRLEPDSPAWWHSFADGRRGLEAGMHWELRLLARLPPQPEEPLIDAYVDRRERLLPHARAQLQRLLKPATEVQPLRAAA